jgi:hypothetical protein
MLGEVLLERAELQRRWDSLPGCAEKDVIRKQIGEYEVILEYMGLS